MSGGWTGSTRRARLPADWGQIRTQILVRDGHRCTWLDDGVRCGQPATDVDHIVAGDDHRPKNLRSLCAPHHRRKTGQEGAAARPREKRRKPKHPGLL